MNWEESLKEKNIRCTRQRMLILNLLKEEEFPLSARDIFLKLKSENPKLRLSTIYRNLNCFEENKIVRRLNLTNKESIFELLEGEHHHHLVCINCGEIIPLKCPLKNFEDSLSRETDYTILEHKLKMFGICPSCRKESEIESKGLKRRDEDEQR